MSEERDQLIISLKENKHAPRFNYEATDMLTEDFLDVVNSFGKNLVELRQNKNERTASLMKIIRGLLNQASKFIFNYMDLDVLKVDVTALDDLELVQLLEKIPFSKREELSQRPWRCIPIDISYDDIIIYKTAGTTAEPMRVPSHPIATGCYSPLLIEALKMWGIEPGFTSDSVGIALIGFQARSITTAARLQALNNSGFTKLNIQETEWKDPLDPYRYLLAIQPKVLTGDAFSFAQLAHLGDLLIEKGEIKEHFNPKALITTAVALKEKLRLTLKEKFKAEVIDLYSLTETGPIAYGCKAGKGYHLLPHDIYIEVISGDGKKLPDGELGEITVTGGRNPYFPLIRYRTGDWGRLDTSGECECGDTMPRIYDLEGRMPVLYHTKDQKWINNRDITAVLENFPVTKFVFHQDASGSFSLTVRLAPYDNVTDEEILKERLLELLGKDADLSITIDPKLGDRLVGKVIPFTTDYALFYD
ncbi:MAG: hypothetical protein ACFFCS_08355 [Candidatus Hodarchaeota archaeon]